VRMVAAVVLLYRQLMTSSVVIVDIRVKGELWLAERVQAPCLDRLQIHRGRSEDSVGCSVPLHRGCGMWYVGDEGVCDITVCISNRIVW
jgi:hypothetical protein